MSKITIQDLTAYKDFLEKARTQIQETRVRAATVVNRELIALYWWLGEHIVISQDKHGWGKSVVERLSQDLKNEFSGKSGFSPQNLWYMRQFYLEYQSKPDLQQLVGEIPWGQNLLILSKVKNDAAKLYYLNATLECGWTRYELTRDIPEKLKDSLPAPEELEEKILFELGLDKDFSRK